MELKNLPGHQWRCDTVRISLAVVAFLFFLCPAVAVPAQLAGPVAIGESSAVLLYVPRSMQEALAQAALVAADAVARESAEAAYQTLRRGERGQTRKPGQTPSENPSLAIPESEDFPIWNDGETYDALLARLFVNYQEIIVAQTDRYESFLKVFPHNWYARHQYAWFLADHFLTEEAAEER